MRKLNKILSLSTNYKKWYAKNKTKEYKSSNDPFYYDVLYELLIIQDGLCAYTELRLIDEKLLKKIKAGFNNGKYSIDYFPQTPAHIEHFSKKEKQQSGWDWNNLFAVDGHINHEKNKFENKYGIDNILKPDTSSYYPTLYLMYDTWEHIFFPHSNLKKPLYDRVFNMIMVLGLNNDFIKMQRREYLKSISEMEYYSGKKQTINQFFTSYSMI